MNPSPSYVPDRDQIRNSEAIYDILSAGLLSGSEETCHHLFATRWLAPVDQAINKTHCWAVVLPDPRGENLRVIQMAEHQDWSDPERSHRKGDRWDRLLAQAAYDAGRNAQALKITAFPGDPKSGTIDRVTIERVAVYEHWSDAVLGAVLAGQDVVYSLDLTNELVNELQGQPSRIFVSIMAPTTRGQADPESTSTEESGNPA